jgi:hypothetical protein
MLAEMERLQANLAKNREHAGIILGECPWTARDRMLKEMGWRPLGTSWAEWNAAMLNRLFEEQRARERQAEPEHRTESELNRVGTESVRTCQAQGHLFVSADEADYCDPAE